MNISDWITLFAVLVALFPGLWILIHLLHHGRGSCRRPGLLAQDMQLFLKERF
jgi:hypothetical protein